MLRLSVRYRHEVLVFPLPETEVTIGSSSRSHLVVPFPGVSRTHARLVPVPGGLRVVDAGSKNGVVRDGRRVPRVELLPGGSLKIGDATLTLEERPEANDLAFALDPSAPSPRRPTLSTASGALDAPASALRLVREMEDGEPPTPARRRLLLPKARATLQADALFIVDATDEREVALREFDGPMPDQVLLQTLAVAAQGGAGARKPAAVPLPDGRIATVARASASRSGPLLVMVRSSKGDPDAPWRRELLAFLATRLLGGSSADESGPPAPPPGPLVLPEALVPGESAAFSGLFSSIEATVRSGLDVLLTGETGTGKELIARMIHLSGAHPAGPFIAINCAAIPNELLEAELFGVQKGAATGVEPRPGRFVQAQGGTLFLDEIGELPEPLQAKLLRVVQEREVLPVGAPSPRHVDVRIVAATNRDLLQRMRQGHFRADLYYRLSALQFHVPPLRDRREDIPALVLAFATRASATHAKRVRGVSRSALETLVAHDWPGNVRELETAVQRAVLICPSGDTLLAEHFTQVRWAVEQKKDEKASDARLEPCDSAPEPNRAPSSRPSPTSLDLEARRNALEKEIIEQALSKAKGNKSLTARLLKISRNGLAARMRVLGIRG